MNKKKAIDFSLKRLEYALDRKGLSKNALAKLAFPDIEQPERKLRKYLKDGAMADEELRKIAKLLDVFYLYLRGKYNVTGEILKSRGVEDLTDYEFDPEGVYYGNSRKENVYRILDAKRDLNVVDKYLSEKSHAQHESNQIIDIDSDLLEEIFQLAEHVRKLEADNGEH